MSDPLYDQVMEVVSRYARDPTALAKATAETNILNDLKVNSTRLVDIILELEEKFSLEISDEDADSINTVGDAMKLLKKLQH